MAADPNDDAWMEECIIAIAAQGGSDVQFAGLTETIDFDIGEKGIEGIPLINGGRVMKHLPEEDTTITFEAYPLEAGTDAGTTGKGFFDLLHTQDTSVPIRIVNDRNRTKYRCLFLWTNDTSISTAQATTSANKSALRIGVADGHFISAKPSFTDGILKWTVVYKVPAFDKAGAGNVMVESAAGATGSDLLPAVASYTTSNKFG